jgi:hypothetical protein
MLLSVNYEIRVRAGSTSARVVEWLQRHVDTNTRAIWTKPKHKYLLPLEEDMRKKILPMAKPYPEKMRRKQRHRCARLPVWRGRGSTERGAQGNHGAFFTLAITFPSDRTYLGSLKQARRMAGPFTLAITFPSDRTGLTDGGELCTRRLSL